MYYLTISHNPLHNMMNNNSLINERGNIVQSFFSLDGAFNKYGGMVADMIILSLMWILFSIPIITIGASTTGLFYAATRRVANREGYITRDFWIGFKSNIGKATVIWLIMAMLTWLVWFNINNMDVVGAMRIVVFPVQVLLIAEIGLMTSYIFPITARFDMNIKQIFKSSFFMANRHLLTSISCLALLVAVTASFLVIPPLAIFLAPGVYAWLASQMVVKILKIYRPELDRDPMVEIQEIEAKKIEERRKRSIGTIAATEEDIKINDTETIDEELTYEPANIWDSLAKAEPTQNDPANQKLSKPTDETEEPDEVDNFWASVEDK